MAAADNSKASADLTVVPEMYEEAADENPSQEFQDLIATLPLKLDSFKAELCQYQDFWFPKLLMQGILKCQNHFQASDSDILLASAPKSGATWLKALVFSIINRNTHNPTTSPILTTNPHVLIPFLEVILMLQDTPNLSSFSSPSSPRILASHIPYNLLPESMKQSRCKIVYLCRNPKDILISLWHFINNVTPESHDCPPLKDFFEDFCRGLSIYGPFWDHMLGYYKESLERPWKVLFLTFEELKSDPVRTLKKLAEFIGYGFSREEENGDVVGNILKLCSFENLSSLEVNRTERSWVRTENKVFFRRGRVGDWKNLLTTDMVERFDTISQEKLEKHGLKF
ncbi:hypothetical protein K1719_022762 [Acacia pycnantha]|nr:hypothetical protein K1719_022762 [Acacia pycnantha]